MLSLDAVLTLAAIYSVCIMAADTSIKAVIVMAAEASIDVVLIMAVEGATLHSVILVISSLIGIMLPSETQLITCNDAQAFTLPLWSK